MHRPALLPVMLLLFWLITLAGTGCRPCAAQDREAHRILLLERPGTVKNFKYNLRDKILLKARHQPHRTGGNITAILDSSLVIDHLIPVNLEDIEIIYRERWVMHWLPPFLLGAGIGYVGIDAVNNLINGGIILKADVLQTGGILAVAGLLLSAVPENRYPCDGRRWRVKILDFEKLRY